MKGYFAELCKLYHTEDIKNLEKHYSKYSDLKGYYVQKKVSKNFFSDHKQQEAGGYSAWSLSSYKKKKKIN